MVGVSAPQGQGSWKGWEGNQGGGGGGGGGGSGNGGSGGDSEEGRAEGEGAAERGYDVERERRVRDGKRDRCVAPRADACSHFRTDTAAVHSPKGGRETGG